MCVCSGGNLKVLPLRGREAKAEGEGDGEAWEERAGMVCRVAGVKESLSSHVHAGAVVQSSARKGHAMEDASFPLSLCSVSVVSSSASMYVATGWSVVH